MRSRRSLPKQQPHQRGPPALMMLLVLRVRSWNEQHENWRTMCHRKIRAGRMDRTPQRCPGGASDALPGAFCAC